MATMAALTEHDESGDDEHEDASEVHEVQSNKTKMPFQGNGQKSFKILTKVSLYKVPSGGFYSSRSLVL